MIWTLRIWAERKRMHGLPPYILFIALFPTFCFNFLYKVRSSNEVLFITGPRQSRETTLPLPSSSDKPFLSLEDPDLEFQVERAIARYQQLSVRCYFFTMQSFAAVIRKTRFLWRIGDSNPWPIDCEPIALPAELIPRKVLRRSKTEIWPSTTQIYQAVTRFSLSSAKGEYKI